MHSLVPQYSSTEWGKGRGKGILANRRDAYSYYLLQQMSGRKLVIWEPKNYHIFISRFEKACSFSDRVCD